MSDTPVLHLFAGKGGAGKTTLALAHALNQVEEHGKSKVLVVSLEPDSGLSDLVKKKLSPSPAKIAPGKGATGGLFAAELDPEALGQAFEKPFRQALAGSVTKGALFSDDEIKKLLEASASNLGELAVLFHLMELVESNEWGSVVVDGPSTSHVIRLLEHPTSFRRLVGIVRGEKTSRPLKNAPPRPPLPVDGHATRLESLQAFLKDPKRFQFYLCTIAEPVAEAQTRLLMRVLTEKGIPVAEIIADMIEDGKGSREVENRRGLQAPHVRKYQTLHPTVDLLQRRIVGPRGLDEVKKFGQAWASGKETKALQFAPAEAPPALVRAPSMPPIAAPPLPPTRFIFFVGTGGVGKSSCAAAAAVTLTEKEGPVLLISTDPSHSLSDVLLSRLTDTETQVKGTKGLYAREIDFATWFGNLKKKLREGADQLFGPEVKGEPFALDREIFRNLLDFGPIGMDELAAMSALTDALVQERFKRIVIDPAPSGGTLRILELPRVARPWFQTLHALLQKHKAKAVQLLQLVEHSLKHLDRFEKAIVNPTECRFVVVTRGEELGIPAAERFAQYLQGKKLPVERVLVNRVLPKTTCPVTEERRRNELEVAKLADKKIGLPVTMAPALGRHPAGLRELKAFRTSWYALSAAPSKVKAA